MLKLFLGIILLTVSSFISTPEKESAISAFRSGEFLKYRVHYSGLTAGFATLNIKATTYNSLPHYHMIGKGWNTGASKLFFKVDDTYETYIDPTTRLPSKFIRKINEGGHTKNKELYFNQKTGKVRVKNLKHNSEKTYYVNNQVQDMLSSFYYLRNTDKAKLYNGNSIFIDMFMDEEVYTLKLKVLGRSTVKTDFGNVKCIKIRPYVQSGRVFKEKESLTMWVTDDSNLIPVLVKAELAVGSLKAELYDYRDVANKINFF